MQLRRSTILALTAAAAIPTAALASTTQGGPGKERLRGTDAADVINGGAGNDHIFGFAGDDQLNGERGNDRLVGGRDNDILDGGPGNDVLYANQGQDTLRGGDGNDRLWALTRRDLTVNADGSVDQNGDTLDGGAGNDVIRARDGEVDHVTCGAGRDVALLDSVDVIDDATADNANGSCEKVIRRTPRAKDSRSEDAQDKAPRANRGRGHAHTSPNAGKHGRA